MAVPTGSEADSGHLSESISIFQEDNVLGGRSFRVYHSVLRLRFPQGLDGVIVVAVVAQLVVAWGVDRSSGQKEARVSLSSEMREGTLLKDIT